MLVEQVCGTPFKPRYYLPLGGAGNAVPDGMKREQMLFRVTYAIQRLIVPAEILPVLAGITYNNVFAADSECAARISRSFLGFRFQRARVGGSQRELGSEDW
jgi:hypothetical protein